MSTVKKIKSKKPKSFTAFLQTRDLPSRTQSIICRRTIHAQCRHCAEYFYEAPSPSSSSTLLSESNPTEKQASLSTLLNSLQARNALFQSTGEDKIKSKKSNRKQNKGEEFIVPALGSCFQCGAVNGVVPLPAPIGLTRFQQDRLRWRAPLPLPSEKKTTKRREGSSASSASEEDREQRVAALSNEWATSLHRRDAYHKDVEPLDMLRVCLIDSDDDDELPVDLPLIPREDDDSSTDGTKQAAADSKKRTEREAYARSNSGSSSNDDGNVSDEAGNVLLRYPPLKVVINILSKHWKEDDW